MTPQSTFLIVAPIQDGQTQRLRRLLHSMNKTPGHADPENSLVPFSRFQGLHVARFVILELHTINDIRRYGIIPHPWRPSLAFLGDCDGDPENFLKELAAKAGSGLKKIFSFCDGFSDKDDLLVWMRARNVKPQANYINWIGRTVRQVHEEAALHKSLAARLPEIIAEVGRQDCRAIRQKLLSHVEMEKAENRLTLTPPEPTRFHRLPQRIRAIHDPAPRRSPKRPPGRRTA